MPRKTVLRSAVPCMLVTALVGSLSVCANAVAAEQLPLQRIVSFADLDLTRNTGAMTLYIRIKSAAKQVCPPEFDVEFPARNRLRCMEQAIDHAVADVNAPTLTNYHLAKTQQPVRAVQQR